jgi:glyoxylate utilization-related uncharacterized protein
MWTFTFKLYHVANTYFLIRKLWKLLIHFSFLTYTLTMELSERCIAQLEKEGWPHIYEWQDKSGAVYEEHEHDGKVVLLITEGAIDFTIDGVTHHLKTGDRMDVPPHTPHSAVVGPEGVQYVVGEEIDGDS